VTPASHPRDLERIGVKAYLDFYGPRACRVGSAWVFRAEEAPDSPMLNRIVGLGVDAPATKEGPDQALAVAAGTTFYVSLSPHSPPLPDRRRHDRGRRHRTLVVTGTHPHRNRPRRRRRD